MMHKSRTWTVSDQPNALTLAYDLSQRTWCGCQGFRHGPYLWLNDATSENGAQEYAVIRESDGRQVESVTASWCTQERMLEIITSMDAIAEPWGGDNRLLPNDPRIESPATHGRCRHCA